MRVINKFIIGKLSQNKIPLKYGDLYHMLVYAHLFITDPQVSMFLSFFLSFFIQPVGSFYPGTIPLQEASCSDRADAGVHKSPGRVCEPSQENEMS